MISRGSAGGGLAMALLSHILHPRPGMSPVDLESPLLGAVLYSPFIRFSTKFNSCTPNQDSDTLTPFILKK